MSLVPFTTQIGPQSNDTQNSQRDGAKIVFIKLEKMSERQDVNMQQCQQLLRPNLECVVRQVNDLYDISPKIRQFVLPYRRDDIFDKIKKRFDRPLVYLPKAILEARGHYNVKLPNRTFAISLTMIHSQIFIVRTCDSPSLRMKINEMTGKIVSSFNDLGTNVVLTDRADDKYCARAFKRNIPIVSKDWVDELHRDALDDDLATFYVDAMKKVIDYQVKPFHGLYFKIVVKNAGPQLKQLITENDGSIVYGNENCLTHIVDQEYIDSTKQENNNHGLDKKGPPKIKVVDINFLYTCAKYGYYLTNKDYQEHLSIHEKIMVKKEPVEKLPSSIEKEENYTPPIFSEEQFENLFDSFDADSSKLSDSTSNVNNSTSPMLPPPSATTNTSTKPARSRSKYQSDNMIDMISRALTTYETAQTQHASTQMRRLPDPVLRIEQTLEPSQQLFWNDSVGRRN